MVTSGGHLGTTVSKRLELEGRLTPAEVAALREFLAGIRQELGSELLEARLFGSRARGEGHEGSDLDIALLVRAGGRRRRHAAQDLAFDILLSHGVSISPRVIEEPMLAELRERQRRIALDIEREGIEL